MRHQSTCNLYESNVSMVYDYGIKRKLVLCRNLRRKGFEVDNNSSKRGFCHDSKLDESLSRTKSTIYELAFCNPWDYFVTLTIDSKKYDRTDLKGYQKALSKWLNNYNTRHKIKVKYLLIPELHKDGSTWHMHGLIYGLPEGHLTKNKNGYLDWLPYSNKFGYLSLGQLKNHEAVAGYITKYISKSLTKSVTNLNANMYYCSQGLKRKVLIKKGTLKDSNIPFDYTNDYVSVKWLDRAEPITNYLT